MRSRMTKAQAIELLKAREGYVSPKKLIQLNGGSRLTRDRTCSGCPRLKEPDGTGAFCEYLKIRVAFSGRCRHHPWGPFIPRG